MRSHLEFFGKALPLFLSIILRPTLWSPVVLVNDELIPGDGNDKDEDRSYYEDGHFVTGSVALGGAPPF